MKSQDIWTLCGGKSNLRSLEATVWRLVEAQHITSTRKLVDSDEEQKILEDEIEKIKPLLNPSLEFKNLHYLLSTPFRYPPLRYGSRFATRSERSLWYGSESLETAQAEVAYYRFLFFDGSQAEFDHIELKLTAFTAQVASKRGINLTLAPFSKWEESISSKTEYGSSQKLGAAMRKAGVEVFRYVSARDIKNGKNLALFTPLAFESRRPKKSQTWACIASSRKIEFLRSDLLKEERNVFRREDFQVEGKLPTPAL